MLSMLRALSKEIAALFEFATRKTKNEREQQPPGCAAYTAGGDLLDLFEFHRARGRVIPRRHAAKIDPVGAAH